MVRTVSGGNKQQMSVNMVIEGNNQV